MCGERSRAVAEAAACSCVPARVPVCMQWLSGRMDAGQGEMLHAIPRVQNSSDSLLFRWRARTYARIHTHAHTYACV